MSWYEHDLHSSDGIPLIDTDRIRETGPAVIGKSELHHGLILCPSEPRYDGALLVGVQVRAIYGATGEVPVVRVRNVGRRPAALVVS